MIMSFIVGGYIYTLKGELFISKVINVIVILLAHL